MQSEHGERVAMTFSFTTFSCSLRRTHRSAICIDRCPVRAILAVSSASSLCFFCVSSFSCVYRPMVLGLLGTGPGNRAGDHRSGSLRVDNDAPVIEFV